MGSSNDTLVWYVNLFSWMVISHKGLNHFIWITFQKNSGAWYLARWQLPKSVISLMRKEHERKLFVLSSFRNSKRILLLPKFNVGHTHNLWVSPPQALKQTAVSQMRMVRSSILIFFNLWKDLISVHPNH